MTNPRLRQQGVALIVGLILLMVMTLLGISIVRTVTMEEKMSANSYDRSLAFYSAESGLRVAEAYVALNRPNPPGTNCDAAGVCTSPDPTAAVSRWLDPTFSGWIDAAGLTLGSLAVTPQYFIEPLNVPSFPACGIRCFPCDNNSASCTTTSPGTAPNCNCRLYRITARSMRVDPNDATNQTGALVMLQSLFRTR